MCAQIRSNPAKHAGDLSFVAYKEWAFAFFVLTPVPKHLQRKLHGVHLYFKCTCPQFLHYYACKHSLCVGLASGKMKVPPEFDIRE